MLQYSAVFHSLSILKSYHVIFHTEWVEGSPNLNGSDPILLWIYLVFMNGLWVVVPLLLLWDSVARISHVSVMAWYIVVFYGCVVPVLRLRIYVFCMRPYRMILRMLRSCVRMFVSDVFALSHNHRHVLETSHKKSA